MFYGKRILELEARVARLEITVRSLIKDVEVQNRTIEHLYACLEGRKDDAPEQVSRPQPKPKRKVIRKYGKENPKASE